MGTTPFPAPPRLLAALVGATLGVLVVLVLGLGSVAFGDYEVETLPAVQLLVSGDVHGFLSSVTAYGGATLLQAPFTLLGSQVGGDLATYRASAVPGLAIAFALALVLAPRVGRSMPRGAAWAWAAAAAFLIAGSPVALLAAEAGHPEEILVAGLAISAVLPALSGRPTAAAAVVGAAAAAKPWALVAVPVILCAATDRRVLARQLVACATAGAIVLAPIVVVQHGGRQGAVAPLATQATGIFKPSNVFWFAGAANPEWNPAVDPTASSTQHVRGGVVSYTKPPAQRLEPSWVGRVSHPLIIVAAFLMVAAYALVRGPGRRSADLLLLLAAVGWWRCLLDSWNTDYYALCAVVALIAWEAWRRRPPVLGAVLTLLVWVTFQLLPAQDLTADVRTTFYLAWALPVGGAMVWRACWPASARNAALRLTGPVLARFPTLSSWARPAAS